MQPGTAARVPKSKSATPANMGGNKGSDALSPDKERHPKSQAKKECSNVRQAAARRTTDESFGTCIALKFLWLVTTNGTASGADNQIKSNASAPVDGTAAITSRLNRNGAKRARRWRWLALPQRPCQRRASERMAANAGRLLHMISDQLRCSCTWQWYRYRLRQ